MQPSAQHIRFGSFEVDLRARELRKQGLKIKLQEQPFQILVMLLDPPGELVTREQLRQKLWPEGTFVDFEHGLNAAIQRLRQSLGDTAENPRFVETVARRGYRFVASVNGVVTETTAVQPLHETHPIEALNRSLVEGGDVAVKTRTSKREVLVWALLSVVLFALLVLLPVSFRKPPGEAHVIRYEIPLPDKVRLWSWDFPTISPDGQKLVFSGLDADGKRHLWFRSLDSVTTHLLSGTENAYFPFWSPDSRFVAFFVMNAGAIKKIDPAAGRPPITLCDLGSLTWASGGTWSRAGVILFSATIPEHYLSLYRVSDEGGTVTPAGQFDKSRHEKLQTNPHFLPDGRHFVYWSGTVDPEKASIALGSLDSMQTRPLFAAQSNVTYAPPGFLVYGRQETLLAQPFDLNKLELKGEPITVAEPVAHAPDNPATLFSASANGVLVYGNPSWRKYQLVWHSRDGAREQSVGEPGMFGGLALSPDEKRVAMFRPTPPIGTYDIWILELASGIFSRVTTDPDDDAAPVWSPNGRELLFSSLRTGELRLFRKVVGGGDEEVLLNSEKDEFASKLARQAAQQWLGDGSILFTSTAGTDLHAFYLWHWAEGRKPVLLLKTKFDKDSPEVSKDGKWVAYQSTESGRVEIYVAAFPTFTEKRQVSKEGGIDAHWRSDGKELFYLSLDGKVMSVDIKTTPELESGVPKQLFQTTTRPGEYCVTGDGQRFLIGEPLEEGGGSALGARMRGPLTVVHNWTAGLKR